MKEHADLEPIVMKYREYTNVLQSIADSKEILQEESDEELRELAKMELSEMEDMVEPLEAELKILLLPKDPNDDKNVICEIRAGAGGEEAALFAYNLYRMYTMYAERKHWTIEVLNEDEVATLSYKLTLKDDFNKEILDEILPTNEKVDITYGEDGHVESDDSPTVRVKEEVPPQKEDNTTAQDPIPQTGNNSFIALAVIVSIAIVLAIVGIQIKKHNNK